MWELNQSIVRVQCVKALEDRKSKMTFLAYTNPVVTTKCIVLSLLRIHTI